MRETYKLHSLIAGAELGTGCVIADFEASADNQISLHVGDMVKIRSKSPSGWWQGEVSISSVLISCAS